MHVFACTPLAMPAKACNISPISRTEAAHRPKPVSSMGMKMASETFQTVIAGERLSYFRELLASAGWKRVEDDCWAAPEHMRDVVARGYGRGSLHLWDALNAQTRFDLWLISETEKAAA